MSNLYRGPSIDASYQVSVQLAERFQRRRLKCEKLTDDKRRTPSDGELIIKRYTDTKWSINSLQLLYLNLTFCSTWFTSISSASGERNSSIIEVSFRRGRTLNNIIVAINREQIGSAMFHPKFSIRTVDMITPTLPRVSANICRNTPVKDKHTK